MWSRIPGLCRRWTLMFELDDDWFQSLLHQTIGAQLLGQVFLRCPSEDVCG